MTARIINKNIIIEQMDEITTEKIENYFLDRNLEVVRWAIVKVENGFLTVNAAIVEE